ncbi:MAG: helix-turn-helix transcriptional regulator [Thauera propionica]|nr:helix-turn-helix transcriptional regulator [Thauera propionica]
MAAVSSCAADRLQAHRFDARGYAAPLLALGYPVVLVSVIQGLHARPLDFAGDASLRADLDRALPFVIERARSQTKPLAWSSLSRPAVLDVLSGPLGHAMSLPVHGPGVMFALVTVGGMPAIGADGLAHSLRVMRDVGWSVLDGLATVFDPRPALALTERQTETLRMLAEGLPHKDVARRLGISVPAVGYLVSRAMNLLGATNQTHAVALAMLSGQLRASVAGECRTR